MVHLREFRDTAPLGQVWQNITSPQGALRDPGLRDYAPSVQESHQHDFLQWMTKPPHSQGALRDPGLRDYAPSVQESHQHDFLPKTIPSKDDEGFAEITAIARFPNPGFEIMHLRCRNPTRVS